METKMLDIPKVLCVDDEPELLHSVSRSLRRGYLVTTATSGKEALEILRKDQSFAVIMSDMRMPGMDGAEFLAQARLLVPDAVRVLLTGFTEMAPVIHAINDGRIFRFLNKPIEKEQLLSVIDAAAAQHRLQAGEQVALKQVLDGSLNLMFEMFALTAPLLCGRAQRVRRAAKAISNAFGLTNTWVIEVAAVLSQLGLLMVGDGAREKIVRGGALSAEEQAQRQRLVPTTDQLLSGLPRLEHVREVVVDLLKDDATGESVAVRILRVASRYDGHRAQGLTFDDAVQQLKADPGCDARVVAALARLKPVLDRKGSTEVRIDALQVGQVLAADCRSSTELLASNGQELTEVLLSRLRSAFENGAIGSVFVQDEVPEKLGDVA